MIETIKKSINNTDVDIFIININETGSYTNDFFLSHFPKRFEDSKKYRFDADRKRSIAAGILLYEVLGINESDLSYEKYGKPVCRKNFNFNISHSGDYAVLAVSRAEVGVDIEKTDRDYRDVLKKVFTEDEIYWAENLRTAENTAYMTIWTLKESVTKALGQGLSMDLKSFSVAGMLNGEKLKVSGKILKGISFIYKDYVVSCAAVCE